MTDWGILQGYITTPLFRYPAMLSDAKLRALKPKDKPYRVYDERGLYIQISTSGAKLWRFKYRFDDKEKLLALGQYPDISLSRARERRDKARQLLARGIDPSAHKQAVKAGTARSRQSSRNG